MQGWEVWGYGEGSEESGRVAIQWAVRTVEVGAMEDQKVMRTVEGEAMEGQWLTLDNGVMEGHWAVRTVHGQ